MDIARSCHDGGAIDFATRLGNATLELIAVLDSRTPEATGRGRQRRAGDTIPAVREVRPAQAERRPPRPARLPVAPGDGRAQSPPGRLGVKLALGYSLGELAHPCAVVDEAKTAGGGPSFAKAVVGVGKVDLPGDAVLWLANASGTAERMKELVGRGASTRPRTGGWLTKCRPFTTPMSILPSGPAVIRSGASSGACSPNTRRPRRWALLPGSATSPRSRPWTPLAGRIARIEYHSSGKDRACNSWLDCDLILVVGTPRVPPLAVRDVDPTGPVDAASRVGDFESLTWEGKTNNGRLVKIDGCGHADPSCAEVYNCLVKETLRQSVGRGRGVTGKGVPILVVSNESLGLPLADRPLPLVSDAEDDTLRLAVSATARNAISMSLANRAVAPVVASDVADTSCYEPSTVRKHLASLSSSGLLKKKGERSGWVVADWLLRGMPTEYKRPY